MKQKQVLVTGGAGFLGSHLCERLLEEGHKVTVLDNLSTGSRENLAAFKDNPDFMFIKHDIIDPIDIKADWIFNLACPASPPRYQADPIHTTKTSVLGIINMLELAKKNKARILQASTSEVYGDPTVHPQPESYWGNVNTIGIRSCYDEGKRCAETLMFDYHRMHKVDIKVIRIFNTYGPRMDPQDGRVISNFIVHALSKKPLEIYGDGSQTRSFCYVDDLIDGMMTMMASPPAVIGPINLGNPIERTIKDMAHLILEETGSKTSIVFKRLPEDDPLRRKPDIQSAKELLSWEPKVSLEDGIKKTITYFSNKGLL